MPAAERWVSPSTMHWILASLLSAFFRGIYELCTKHAVHRNAVLPVLFLANLVSAGVWGSLLVLQRCQPELLPAALIVAPLTLHQHGLLMLKSFIVASSWVATYFAVKHLPVSIASPIRATAPVWTLFGALLVFSERPDSWEWAGVVIILVSVWAFSVAGKREGIHFHRNRWVGWAVVGMLLGTISSLYDKHLLGNLGLGVATVQAWFSIYLACFFLFPAVGWKLRWWSRQEFHWRWSIVFLSLTLLVFDYCYFHALRDPEALVSVVAALRQGSTVVAFSGGVLLFGEVRDRRKTLAVVGLLAGIVITLLG